VKSAGSEPTVFPLLLLALAGLSVWSCRDLSPVARVAPLAAGLPTAAALAFQLYRDLRGGRPPASAAGQLNGERAGPEPAFAAARTGGREAQVFGWVLLLPAGIGTLGFAAGVPLYSLAFLKWYGGLSVRSALLFSAIMWALIYGGMEQCLRISLYSGWLWRWMEG
jgi:hypothetical protein